MPMLIQKRTKILNASRRKTCLKNKQIAFFAKPLRELRQIFKNLPNVFDILFISP